MHLSIRAGTSVTRAARLALTLLAFGAAVPVQAASCAQEARLRADPRWTPRDTDNCDHCMFNRASVGPGAVLLWNRRPVSEATLARYLGLVATMRPLPITLLRIESGADCALLARVVAAIEAKADCGGGMFCGYGLAREAAVRPGR